jgi:hypothetical protein
MPLDGSPTRLDEIAVLIRTTWARVTRDVAVTQQLLNEARELCRQRRESFDVWCKSGEFGISKTQIYRLLDGKTSGNYVPLGDVSHEYTGDYEKWTPAGRGHFHSQNDSVSTRREFAKRIVAHFPIQGLALDPCRGSNHAFYDALPDPKDWCEIHEGRDFLDWKKPVAWGVTNPPWSAEAYRPIARHAFKICDNVVFLLRWHTATSTYARHRDWLEFGHVWRETLFLPWKDAAFHDEHGNEKTEGFILAAFWWQRGWTGGMQSTYWL